MNICQENRNLDRSSEIIGPLTGKPGRLLFLPTILNRHKSVVFGWNGMRLLEWPRRYKH